jgi:hypothetical protein
VDSGRVEQFCNSKRPQIGVELCPHRRHERLDTHDVYDAGKIVGEYVHCHLGGHAWQRLHQEVGCSHPGLKPTRLRSSDSSFRSLPTLFQRTPSRQSAFQRATYRRSPRKIHTFRPSVVFYASQAATTGLATTLDRPVAGGFKSAGGSRNNNMSNRAPMTAKPRTMKPSI